MSTRQKVTADFLFAVQIVCTLVFGIGQFSKMLTTAQGVSISWIVCWEIFLVLNLRLALRAQRNQPSRVTRQTIVSYTLWTLMVSLDLVVMFAKGTGQWNGRDTFTLVLVTLGAIVIIWVGRRNKLAVSDPMVRGFLALCFKAVPQLVLAYNMVMLGGNGLAWTTVVAGHITVCTRLGQLWFSIKEAGWDRNRKGSAISEIGNEASWIVATIVWLVK